MNKKLNRLQIFIIIIVVITSGLAAYGIGIPSLDLIELKTVDLRFQSRTGPTPGSDIVLAVIDEKSLASQGKWVWPRSTMAALIGRLSDAGVRVIGFDIGFFEPGDQQSLQTIEKIRQKLRPLADRLPPEVNSAIEQIRLASDNDRILAQAIKNSSVPVVLGYFFQVDRENSPDLTQTQIDAHLKNVNHGRYQVEKYASKDAHQVPLLEPPYPQSNIPVISEAASRSGYFNMKSDRDGVVRWLPAIYRCQESLYAPLSLMIASAYLNSPLSVVIEDYGVSEIQVGSIRIPTDEQGKILINYRGEPNSFAHLSISDILEGKIPDRQLKEKVVLIGATAAGIYDLRVTPLSSVFPGVEIHANIIDSILAEDFLYRPEWADIFDVIAIISIGAVLGFLLPRLNVVRGLTAALIIFIGYIALCQYLFSTAGVVLNLVYPLSVILMLYVSITAYRYFQETKLKRFIKNAFSTYLAPTVVKQLIDSPDQLVLGGEERQITAFFSDVENFTSISELLSARQLVDLLNEFLTEMTNIILDNEGTVDKFEGDAIIAFFGAPNLLENHAERACRASIAMQSRLSALRDKWQAEGRPQLKMRIGLCSGKAVVGNMGAESKMDYTMMGDTVNTAARLEGVNKIYGVYSLLGESAVRAAGDQFAVREIDTIKVAGKNESVTIFELMGYVQDQDDSTQQLLEKYAEGLTAYRSKQWRTAATCFTEALQILPDDGPSQTMLDRCRTYQDSPPEPDWDGIFVITSK